MPLPYQVAVIGEVLWDVFPNQRRLGGAFACLTRDYPKVYRGDQAYLPSCFGDQPAADNRRRVRLQTVVGTGQHT